MLKSPFSGYSNGNAQTYKRLAGQSSQLNPTLQEKYAKKSALALFMLRLGTANHTDDTITLNDFAVTA